MPANKTSPAAETKTLTKNDSNSKENTKAAIASFKQNPYYSPLYDCDVNYFRYAFSSDSLTIKSAVAIKSIDIKPLKKDEKTAATTNKPAKTNNVSSEAASDMQSTSSSTKSSSHDSKSCKNLSNPLTKSKSMIQTNVLQAKQQTDNSSSINDKSAPVKTMSGAMPTIKKSKSIIALNKKDGGESKFSTVKKSVKFKNEDIVKEIKSDQPLIDPAAKLVHLPTANTPMPFKPTESSKNQQMPAKQQAKSNEVSKPVVNYTKPSTVKPASESSTSTAAATTAITTTNTAPTNNAAAAAVSKINIEPIKPQPVVKQQPKPVDATQKPIVAANKPAINQNNHINHSNSINNTVSKTNVATGNNSIQNTKLDVAKSSNNLANMTSQQAKPTHETAKSTPVNNTGTLPAKSSSLIKPAEMNKSQSNLVIQPKQQSNEIKKMASNQSVHLMHAPNKALEPVKATKTMELVPKANASLNLKPANSLVPTATATAIKTNASDSIKNVSILAAQLQKSHTSDTGSHKQLTTSNQKPATATPAPINSKPEVAESSSLKNITNIPLLSQSVKNASKTSFSSISIGQTQPPIATGKTKPKTPSPIVSMKLPTANNKIASNSVQPQINKTTKLAAEPISVIHDYETMLEIDLSDVERSKSPELTYRLSNLNQELKLINRVKTGQDSVNVSLVDLVAPTTTQPAVNAAAAAAAKIKSPPLKSVTFSSINENLPAVKSPTEPLVPILKSLSPGAHRTSHNQINQEKPSQTEENKIIATTATAAVSQSSANEPVVLPSQVIKAERPVTPIATPPITSPIGSIPTPPITPTNSVTSTTPTNSITPTNSATPPSTPPSVSPAMSPKLSTPPTTNNAHLADIIQDVVNQPLLSETENYSKKKSTEDTQATEDSSSTQIQTEVV